MKIGNGLEEIGAGSFRKCTKLEEITLPKSLDEIERYAFYGCKRLKKLTINANAVVDIDAKAITGTSKKLIINVPNKFLKMYKKEFTQKTGFIKSMKLV